MIAFAVGGAGALGACARYVIDAAVSRRSRGLFPNSRLGTQSFPFGTLLINVSGSLVLGLLTGVVLHHGAPADLLTIAGTGFCGGFTTWSTFSWESTQLYRYGHRGIGFAQVVVHVGACLAAATVGLVVTGA